MYMYKDLSHVKQLSVLTMTTYLCGCMFIQKKTNTVAERSFAVGTIAETMHAMGPAAASFSPTLYPLLQGMLRDEDEEVRSNAAFAMGVVVANGGQNMYSYPCLDSKGSITLYISVTRRRKSRIFTENKLWFIKLKQCDHLYL